MKPHKVLFKSLFGPYMVLRMLHFKYNLENGHLSATAFYSQ